jgi:Tfp pilus assembly protein PilE
MLQYGALVIVCLIAAILYPAYKNYKKCDLKNSNNRIFKTFYGLENSFIPFGKYNAELNTKTPLFTPIIKENIDAASIIVIGEFGRGQNTHSKLSH